MYDSYKIAERIREKLKEKGITSKKMLEDLNFGKETILTMEKGSMIKCDRLGMIADYLKCSVDYLLGREEKITYNIQENKSIYGNIGHIEKDKSDTDETSYIEKAIFQEIKKLSKTEQIELLASLNKE